ncbi:hypothetical protein M413DRAFT_31622 [Hebeloma cylindrosporum]|uniref:DUF6533 domain-containing protein n=1 Tax=Hebeloma cylindrosporum TaxID=76867 RepID=A0A0C3BYT6_HEBCY|nr:hypothetical protein M413DRAFT_31622 [Hebeloma cylindrosporum h7]
MSQSIPDELPDISDTIRTNYVGFASFVVLLWDHIDTFSDEVELIWKGKRKGLCFVLHFAPVIYLFLFHISLRPGHTKYASTHTLSNVINSNDVLPSFLPAVRSQTPSHSGTHLVTHQLKRCARFVRYEGFTVAIAVEVVGLMMLLRINALYPHQKWISRGLAAFLLFETGMNAWLISRGQPVVHNPSSGIHACSMVFDPSISVLASSSAWIPLLYDTIIFALTLYRTIPPIRREEASYIVKRLLEDGLLYYSVIFSVTCVLTFMIVAAPPGTKNIAAQMEQLITVAMMSRITLNLKKAGDRLHNDALVSPKSILFDRNKRHHRRGSSAGGHPSLILSLHPIASIPSPPCSPISPPAAPPPTHGHDRITALTFAHAAEPPRPASLNTSVDSEMSERGAVCGEGSSGIPPTGMVFLDSRSVNQCV